jgi:5-methylcytosine-specific restriction endonuclease McrA
MDYKKHYDLLIERSRNRIIDGYVEKHHIIPKCLGGSDDMANIAILTPEEHFLAHQLLIKLNPGHIGLIYAVQMMTNHQTDARTNNKLFGWIRRRMALAMSEKTKTWLKEHGHPKGMLGKKHTGSGLVKILAAQAAIIDAKKVKVYAYELNGMFFKEYSSITECANDLNTSPSNVKYTADGDFGYCKNKQIRYVYADRLEPYIKSKSKLIGHVRSETHQENLRNAIKNNKATCTRCGITTHKSAITRAHNDNCKRKL